MHLADFVAPASPSSIATVRHAPLGAGSQHNRVLDLYTLQAPGHLVRNTGGRTKSMLH